MTRKRVNLIKARKKQKLTNAVAVINAKTGLLIG